MIKEELIQQRLYKHFYRPNYNNEIFGIQAQNIDAAALSMFLRDNKITHNQFHNAVMAEDFFRTWGPRNTLHIYCAKYYELLYQFNLVYGNWFERKWRKKNPELYFANIQNAIDLCKQNRFVSRQLLIENGIAPVLVDNWGGIFIDLCQKGVLLPAIINNKTEFVCVNYSASDYRDNIWKNICYLYFDHFGPATCSDFAHWLSIDTGKAQAIIDSTTQLLKIDDKFFNTSFRTSNELFSHEEILITSKFDNIFLGYADKSWIVDKEYLTQVWIKSGLVEATIIYHNNVVGTWRYKKDHTILAYVKLFYELDDNIRNQILTKLTNILTEFWDKPCTAVYVESY